MAVTREDTLALKPQSMSHAQAASGGTGIFAVQIAKALGGAVTAVCSAGNHQLVADLGANRCVDYRRQRITEFDRTFDVIYDAEAASSFARCRAQLKPSGVFVSNLPSAGGLYSKMAAPLARLIGRRQKNDFAWVKPSGADLELIRQMIDAGQLRTIIDRTYAPGAIREAHDHSQPGRVRGKLVVDFGRA